MQRNTGTIFKVFLAAKSKPGKEEFWLKLWKHKGKLVKPSKPIPFDRLDEIPDAIKSRLVEAGIHWPPSK